jgi:hypothetical protein
VKFPLLILVITLPLGCPAFADSPYRYTLNPNNAEQVLATLAKRPRLMDQQWLDIVGEHRDDNYTVLQGDSLWAISKRVLNNPFLWRKLWEENPELSNPHELTVGAQLSYYHPLILRKPASDAEPAAKPIPVIKLTKAGMASTIDIDEDSFVNRDVKNRSQNRFMVLADDDDQIIAELTGAYSLGDVIAPTAALYIDTYDDLDFKEGQRFTVIHLEREIKDTSQDGSPVLGNLYTIVANISSVEKGAELWRMQIDEMFTSVTRGDLVIPYVDPVKWTTSMEPPNKLQARVLGGEDPDYRLFGQNQLVLLSKGSKDGMKEGFLFRVWRDTDPTTESKNGVEPISKGDVRVIFAGPTASVGLILRNTEPLEVGDTVVPCQVFTNPPEPPQKDLSVIEID